MLFEDHVYCFFIFYLYFGSAKILYICSHKYILSSFLCGAQIIYSFQAISECQLNDLSHFSIHLPKPAEIRAFCQGTPHYHQEANVNAESLTIKNVYRIQNFCIHFKWLLNNLCASAPTHPQNLFWGLLIAYKQLKFSEYFIEEKKIPKPLLSLLLHSLLVLS